MNETFVEIDLVNDKGTALIDVEDAHKVSGYKWYLHRGGYAYRNLLIGGRHRFCLLHRLITSAPRGSEVDHLNHNKLDCRKSNLRVVDKSRNMQNRKGADRRNKLGLRGVIAYRTKAGIRYRASVQLFGRKCVYRHGITTPEEAAVVAAELRSRYFDIPPTVTA